MKCMTEDIPVSFKSTGNEHPIWSEEFNAGDVPDGAVWSYDLGAGGWGNFELQTYTREPENLRVADGNLIITALKKGNGFTSGRIKTEGKFSYRYGTVEARIQMPAVGNGLWPALWALGSSFSSIGWPACGEIILMEMGVGGAVQDGVANRRIMSAAHWEHEEKHATHGLTRDQLVDMNGSFHIFRMEWTPSEITTYVDNTRIWTLDISDIPQFHKPHFLLLNLAVGGDQTGICDPGGITAPFPAEYRVDYIRLFDNGFTVLSGSSTRSKT